MKQIRGGADFAKLVAQYSEDPASKAAGGDFGVVNTNSSYSADVKKAVLALKAGEVTDPLRQSNAFYIIRVEEKTTQPMDELRGAISDEIRQAHLNEWLAGVGKKFEPKWKTCSSSRRRRCRFRGARCPAPPPRNNLCFPELAGRPIRVEVRRSLGSHLAGASIPRRLILLDAAVFARRGEFERILIHELFHFAWVRLSNQQRRALGGHINA